jgi:hypothetical protein
MQEYEDIGLYAPASSSARFLRLGHCRVKLFYAAGIKFPLSASNAPLQIYPETPSNSRCQGTSKVVARV